MLRVGASFFQIGNLLFQIHPVFQNQCQSINGKDNQTTKLMPRTLSVVITIANDEVYKETSGIYVHDD